MIGKTKPYGLTSGSALATTTGSSVVASAGLADIQCGINNILEAHEALKQAAHVAPGLGR